jgi:molybdopterin molybdotransferase
MISVEEARSRILQDLAPTPAEQVTLPQALGRILAEDLCSRRTQPPRDVSAMDGYALRADDAVEPGATLRVVAEIPAGASYNSALEPGDCVRIFTGAPLPPGADSILIQEDATRSDDGATVTFAEAATQGRWVRKAGLDFSEGDVLLKAGHRLTARDIGIAAAMNRPWLSVHRRPRVAILATGDEIAMPGDPVGPNQIVSSNGPALAAAITAAGGEPILLGVALDDRESLTRLAAGARGADLLITTGGASVGDHDLVAKVLGEQGLSIDFWKIAMRPGKPLMFGQLGDTPMIGLPGNPVSTLVCFLIFVRPALLALAGDPQAVQSPVTEPMMLGAALPENDRRQDYLRATLSRDSVANTGGNQAVYAFETQDSSMLSRLTQANCLIVRAPHAPALEAGETVEIIRFPSDF